MIWGIKKTDFGFRHSKRNILLIQDFGRWLKSENKAVHVSRTVSQNSLAQPRKSCWLQVCPKFYFSGWGIKNKVQSCSTLLQDRLYITKLWKSSFKLRFNLSWSKSWLDLLLWRCTYPRNNTGANLFISILSTFPKIPKRILYS